MKTTLISVTLGLTLVAGGCGSNDAKTTAEEPVIPVTAARVARGDICAFIHVTGTIFPWQESMISPKVSGRIEKLHADEGDRVTGGTILAELEQERLLIMIREAKASLQESRAQLRNLEATLERSRKLFREGVLDSQRFDDTTTERDLSLARVSRAEALLERAEQDFKDSIITAPFDGFVVEKLMNEGEMATTMPPSNIFHLVDTSRVKIECDINEEKRTAVSIGKQASIVLDAYPGEIFTGNITTVNPKVDISSRTFTVKIEIPNPDFKLESGMFARIRIAEQESHNALLISQKVIIDSGTVKKVFLVVDGRARERAITTGILTAGTAEITGGLSEGDIIVTQGFYALKDGIKVLVQERSGGEGGTGEPS